MSKISEIISNQTSEGNVVHEHLTLKGILNDIGSELKHQVEFGAHEMASALFRGDGFVMYPKAGQEAEAHQGHGLPQEVTKQVERDGPSM